LLSLREASALRLADLLALSEPERRTESLNVSESLALSLAEVRIESEMEPDRLALLLWLTERLLEKDAL
jgi:hypothetical protein